MADAWTTKNIPDLTGKRVVITGANSGIGYEAAKVLAGKGAHVILAVRNATRGQAAQLAIRRLHPAAIIDVMLLDLADLQQIRDFVERFRSRWRTLSLLINNAGVMAPPLRKTKDGFELQFGTNHLGHFALTGWLLPCLLRTPDSRVVTVSSMAHKSGRIDFANLDGSQGYSRWRFYGQSKVANLLFAYELQRRLANAQTQTMSVACHPGFAATNLTAAGIGYGKPWLGKSIGSFAKLMAQSAQMGALPILYAATEQGLSGGEYIGPLGRGGMRGFPGVVTSSALSHDEAVAAQLWTVSEELTGVQYEFTADRD